MGVAGQLRDREGEGHFHLRLRGRMDHQPGKMGQLVLPQPAPVEVGRPQGPRRPLPVEGRLRLPSAGPRRARGGREPGHHDAHLRHALLEDPADKYQALVKEFASNPAKLDEVFAKAWHKLTTRAFGAQKAPRCVTKSKQGKRWATNAALRTGATCSA